MYRILAKAISSSIDDENGRIKVTAEGVWKESPLISVMNNWPISKDEVVIVDMSKPDEPIVVGKLFNKEYIKVNDNIKLSITEESWLFNEGKQGILNGKELLSKLNDICDFIKTHTHTSAAPGSSTTAPTLPMTVVLNESELLDNKIKH